ncbi:uncharacterized protein AC631_05863 [Debaryomyces fabryi]|uniref:Uncharacterized protein n=1 Tax=Debaryomyces fabryi TaxID=58627 RepID=A0A0V1PQR0_9ASCO|nr:uncharacterized protein AC631_05863 [Debaryomyces fabryi]KRZ98379.1 hypothetical protein AC631_05863 [Debaryomyces fabryi]CUM57372.1 unnamed protein product [Debaryomyces fabryi]
MTEVSPSSKKVDDFLSSISELSQERLREDQKRQRDLQRNIDDLRLRLNSSSPIKGSSYQPLFSYSSTRGHGDIPLLKFNRSGRLNIDHFSTSIKNLEEDAPPEMPLRPSSVGRQYRSSRLIETPPPMPRRPANEDEESPPPMPPRRDVKRPGPTKPSKPSGMSSKFDIELINPVPIKVKPELRLKKDFKEPPYKLKSPSNEGNKYRSFTELENDIKKGSDLGGNTKDMVEDIFSVNSKTNPTSKPIKPIKSDKLSTKLTVEGKVERTPNIVPKPTYLSALSATKHNSDSRLLQSASSGAKQRFIPDHNDPSDVSIIKPTSPQREKKQNSWLDSAIKKSDTLESLVKTTNSQKDWSIKNAKPLEPSLFATSKSPEPRRSDFKTPPKPPKPSLEKYTRTENELLKSQMQKLSSSTNRAAPPKPAKPSISKYEEQDTEILKAQMQKLSHGKNAPPKPSKPSPKKYQEEDNAILISQMKKLGKKSNPSIIRDSTDTNPEGLAALAKLKPVKAAPLSLSKIASYNSMPEPTKTIERMKTSDRSLKSAASPERPVATKSPSSSDLNENKPPKTPASFQDQLSSIIRASTVPNVRASKPASNIPRANTLPLRDETTNVTQSKLTHPNKGRSKGPKRRLPKKMANNPSTVENTGSADVTANTDKSSTQINDFKQKKIPPPINKASKQKALDNLKPSRNFSGELFI